MINMPFPSSPGPIGVFDSGYGGLIILHGIRQRLPQYDYMHLGDNALLYEVVGTWRVCLASLYYSRPKRTCYSRNLYIRV